MKIDLSQWTEEVGHSVAKMQSGPKRIWIRPNPQLPLQPESAGTNSNTPAPITKMVLKYKTVDKKIRPVPTRFPENMKVRRQFPEDPLRNLSILPYYPPEFTPTDRVTEERMESLKIDEGLELWPEEKKLLKLVIALNGKSIAFDEQERGTFKTSYFSDYKMPVMDHIPWQEKNMPIPPGYRDEIIKLLKEKIDAGVYEEAQSSYRSRWFCVKKKNGELRIVHDLQKLNGVSIKDAGVPPILEDFVNNYAGRSIYTVLDMYWGFHARMLDVESRDMTAFQTPLGALRIVSLPMGYTNSPAEFQACMTFILKDEIPHIAGVFIDDIPIKGPQTRYLDDDEKEEVILQNPGIRRYVWEHLNDVHRILHRIGESGGTVSGKKMQLCQSEVEIVGNKCSPKGREPVDARIKSVIEWPTPKNLTEVRGFLGLCGTVRIWIEDFSLLTKPLVDLTRKDKEFNWGLAQEEAFQRLKHLITSAPVVRPIEYKSDRPVYLSVDTSIHGVGFILSQEDKDGKRAPARYGSIPLKGVESRYGQSKLELYGLFKALHEYRGHIAGVRNLIVEVDASSIKGMLDHPDIQVSAVINRWIQGILQFDFKLVHVPAYKHKGPDALSRRPVEEGDSEDSDTDEWVDHIALVTQVQHTPPKPISLSDPFDHLDETCLMGPSDSCETDIKASFAGKIDPQIAEDELNNILRYLVTQESPELKTKRETDNFLHKAEQFYIQGIHMYQRRNGSPPRVVIFDKTRRRAILWEMHEENGHHGVWAVSQQTALRYHWPYLKKDVKQHIRSCHTCQLRSTKKMHQPVTMSHPPQLFSKVYLDVMKMPKANGKEWLVACRDDLSGITECQAMGQDNAKNIAKFFLEQIIFRYGTVQEVVTDNGSSFKRDFKRLLKNYGINQIKISPYNSQANGVVERGHFNIREALVKLSGDNLKQWPQMVSAACYADRITTRRATGYSPFYLLHGTHPMMPCDLADATFMVSEFQPGMTEADLIAARTQQLLKMPQDVEKARQILRKSRFKSKEAYETKFARRLQKEDYEPGTLVLVRNNPIENSVSIQRKTHNRYIGPYRVIRRTQGGSYALEEMSGNALRHTTAAFRLIPYVQREDLDELAKDFVSGNESEAEKASSQSASESSGPASTQSDTENSTDSEQS